MVIKTWRPKKKVNTRLTIIKKFRTKLLYNEKAVSINLLGYFLKTQQSLFSKIKKNKGRQSENSKYI